MFPEFGNKNIHATAQEVVIFSPHIRKDIFSFECFIGIVAEIFKQVGFLLCDRNRYFPIGCIKAKVFIIEGKLTNRKQV